MSADISKHLNDVVDKFQHNMFVCTNCNTMIAFAGSKYAPVFPCDECGKVKWKVYSINGTVIYK